MFEPCIPKKELQYSCDLCGDLPITGRRWCCNVCEDFGASPALDARGRPAARPRSPPLRAKKAALVAPTHSRRGPDPS